MSRLGSFAYWSLNRVKLVGYNPLMLAIRQGSEPDKAKKVVDFLLAKSVSPAERDYIKGYCDYRP